MESYDLDYGLESFSYYLDYILDTKLASTYTYILELSTSPTAGLACC